LVPLKPPRNWGVSELITPIPQPVLSTSAAQCSVGVKAPGIHAPPLAPGPRKPTAYLLARHNYGYQLSKT
jgi:hypothetical protein